MRVARCKGNEIASSLFRECYTVTNLIPNPSFERNEKWQSLYDTTEHLYGSRSVKLKATGTTMCSTSMPLPILNHVYYGRHSIKTAGNATPADCRFEWFAGDGNGKNFVFGWNQGNHPDWFTESSTLKITYIDPSVSSFILRNFTVNPGVEVWSDGLMLIDLTAAFGEGKEPDKAWCDNNIPFFEGTYDIPITLSIGIHGIQASLLTEITPHDKFALLPSGVEASLFRETIALTNLAEDGDMSKNLWGTSSVWSYDTTHFKYGTRAMKITAADTVPEVCVAAKFSPKLFKGHIYYGRIEGYQETQTQSGANIYWPIAEPSFGGASLGEAGKWNLYSWRVIRNHWEDGTAGFRLDFDNNYHAGSIWYDGIMLIDLTAAFGSGKEPSKAWCDKLPFFTGNKEFTLEGDLWLY